MDQSYNLFQLLQDVANNAAADRAGAWLRLAAADYPWLFESITNNLHAEPEHNRVRIETLCRLTGKTGVEMEALTAASVAALTIYDMCKAVQKDMVIGPVRLLAKSGGKSGDFKVDAHD